MDCPRNVSVPSTIHLALPLKGYQPRKNFQLNVRSTVKRHRQNTLNTPSTESSHRKAQETILATKLAGTEIHQRMTIWNLQNTCRSTLYTAFGRKCTQRQTAKIVIAQPTIKKKHRAKSKLVMRSAHSTTFLPRSEIIAAN